MRTFCLIGLVVIAISGCDGGPVEGSHGLKAGQDARLVSPDGSDVRLDYLVSSAPEKKGRPTAKASQPEETRLPAGTRVVVRAIDGDDVKVEIKEGPRAGSVYWAQGARLEAVAE